MNQDTSFPGGGWRKRLSPTQAWCLVGFLLGLLGLFAFYPAPTPSGENKTPQNVSLGLLLQAAPSTDAPLPGAWDQSDLAQGLYSNRLAPIGLNDPRFQDVLAWLQKQGAPKPTEIVAQPTICLNNNCPNKYQPAEIWWTQKDGTVYRADAAQTYYFPHVTLTELQQFYGFGDPKHSTYYTVPVGPQQFVAISPIGAAWPDKAPNAYRPADKDTLPDGTRYVDATGAYNKVDAGGFFSWFAKASMWLKEGSK